MEFRQSFCLHFSSRSASFPRLTQRCCILDSCHFARQQQRYLASRKNGSLNRRGCPPYPISRVHTPIGNDKNNICTRGKVVGAGKGMGIIFVHLRINSQMLAAREGCPANERTNRRLWFCLARCINLRCYVTRECASDERGMTAKFARILSTSRVTLLLGMREY